MSEYVDIKINSLSLYSFRNYLKSDIFGFFFQKMDLEITPDCIDDPNDEDSVKYTRYSFRTTVKKAKERLDACGFSLLSLEEKFNNNIFTAIDYSSFLSYLKVPYDEYEEKSEKRIEKYVTFQKWKNSMHKIISYEINNGEIKWNKKADTKEVKINTECDKVIFYSLKEYDSESFYGINLEVIPISFVFRLILENCHSEEEILLDITPLIGWSYESIDEVLSSIKEPEKTIVLVEGTTDKAILEFSMSKLYPHLIDLFYFMDFDDNCGAKRDGGSSFLVKNLKTFYFSKIKSQFIAIFDNDAEGYQSKCTLLREIAKWPNNFRILLYPEIKEFSKYPTIAPNGEIVEDNINNKACSIELYLPDRLIMKDGEFYAIEWESRKKIKDEKGDEIALYQGVILNKNNIISDFYRLRNKIEEFNENEWKRMKTVLDSIVCAFT